jgi:hypothetical protein
MKAGIVSQVQSHHGATLTAAHLKLKSRLILQDPLALEQANQPSLRASQELATEPTSLMEREQARELWESLNLEPEVAQDRQAERKRLLARADQYARDEAEAQARSLALEQEIARAKDERFNHPAVYAGAAGLVGLATLWLLERRKRLKQQYEEVQAWAQLSRLPEAHRTQEAINTSDLDSQSGGEASVFLMEDAPDEAPQIHKLTPNAPKPKKASASIVQGHELSQRSNRASLQNDDEELKLLRARTAKEETPSFLRKTRRVFGQLWNRPATHSELNSTGFSTNSRASLNTESFAYSTAFQKESALHTQFQQVEPGHELSVGGGFEPDHPFSNVAYSAYQANIDLLTKIPAKPTGGESAIEHLLELRMAANGLCALGRPRAAIELLQAHIDADEKTCAWAYLECMKICEQVGEREAFEAMRKRYRQQFNRMAPYWQEPNSNVLGLDGYARATAELCTAWAVGHAHAREMLAAWLVGPLLSRKLVQLPAYYDLFDLYETLEYIDREANKASDALNAQALINNSSVSKFGSSEALYDFVPTVSLLDLDYEFSSDVSLAERDVEQSEKAITIVKPGNFSVDFDVAGTRLAGQFSVPAQLNHK